MKKSAQEIIRRTGGQGTGEDVVYGEGGADKINGDAGNDILFGGAGDDTLVAAGGYNCLWQKREAANDAEGRMAV